MENKIIFLLLLCVCSCSYGERNNFDNYDELSQSPSMKDWIPFEVPKDARKIEIWHNIDTNSVRASFELSRGFHGIDGYQNLSDSLKENALRNYPAIQEISPNLKIWYQCKSTKIKSLDGIGVGGGLREVRYIGDTGRKIFYWNDKVPENYEKACNGRRA